MTELVQTLRKVTKESVRAISTLNQYNMSKANLKERSAEDDNTDVYTSIETDGAGQSTVGDREIKISETREKVLWRASEAV